MFERGHPDDPSSGQVRSGSRADAPAGLGGGSGDSRPVNRLNLLLTAPPWGRESWADRLPPLLGPIGILAIRAQSAREAEHVIRSAPGGVHIAVVDLTLPLDERGDSSIEEGGTRILDLLARMPAPPPTVVVQAPRGHRDGARSMNAALRCGAFAVVDRSAADLEVMLEVMRRVLARFYGSRWPGAGQPPAAPPGVREGGGDPARPERRGPFPGGPNVC